MVINSELKYLQFENLIQFEAIVGEYLWEFKHLSITLIFYNIMMRKSGNNSNKNWSAQSS